MRSQENKFSSGIQFSDFTPPDLPSPEYVEILRQTGADQSVIDLALGIKKESYWTRLVNKIKRP